MPWTTCPKGAKRIPSRRALSHVVDEDLGGAAVGHVRLRERDEAALVRLRDRVVGDVRLLPLRAHRRIAAEPELDHEAVDGAEEPRVVEEAELDEVVEAVGAVRRPVAVHLDDEGALRRGELRLEDVGRLLLARSPDRAARGAATEARAAGARSGAAEAVAAAAGASPPDDWPGSGAGFEQAASASESERMRARVARER